MEPFLGQIQLFGFNFAPQGWALCQGQILSIAQNTALFSLLGTTYGGNGQTTFALPNLAGRSAIGQGQSPGLSNYTIGEQAGSENTTLTQLQMPQHTHTTTITAGTATATAASTLNGVNTNADSPKPGNKMLATQSGANMYFAPPAGAALNAMDTRSVATTVSVTQGAPGVQLGIAGGSQPFNIQSPYLCLNYCIALEGIFPSRN